MEPSRNTAPATTQVRFADFEFNLRTGQLTRAGSPIKLQQQPGRVLTLLVSRAGEVVTRQELAQTVWGSETFVDFEQGLNFAVRHIRAALGDDPEQPRFLQTIPKVGYRFIAPVEGVVEQTKEAVAGPIAAKAGDAASHTRANAPTPSRAWAAAAVGVLILAVAAIRYFGNARPGADSKRPIHSLAVLPLVSLSSDPEQEYFSDGLTDEVITELAKVGGLRVISRTSTSAYKGTKKRVPEIAAELHVDAIVEGTVERQGNHIRIRTQLVQADTDQHLWAEGYDGEIDKLSQLENLVARDISGQVGRIADPEGKGKGEEAPVAAAAHEDYLRGRYYWNKRTEAGLRKGIEYFQKAIDQEPNYAQAYAGLADSYIMLANWGFAAPGESYALAKAAAVKALELNPRLAEAHTSLAYVTLLYEWNWQEAEGRFRQAIAINPNYVSAHHFYSICLMTAGRQAEALAEIQRAAELDPLSLIVGDVYGWIYYEGRQYDRAIEQYKKTLEMDPRYVPAILDLGTSYLRTGDYVRALEQFRRAQTLQGDNAVVLSALGQAYALSGQQAEARKILGQLAQPLKKTFISSWEISLIHCALREDQQAIAFLERAADDHVGWVVRLGVDPAVDSLRQYSDFHKLTKRIGIPDVLTKSR